MVQKSEKLRESGAAPYSDVSCVEVSLSTSRAWSDRNAPRLRPLQLLAHTYTTDFIATHAAMVGVLSSNK